ncbi:MAG TPA: hypothetical protein VH817_16690 [Thermoleophilaceae bacterium]|jgi:hypothetical protein
MSQSIPQQHPAVVLRSHYVHLRALLLLAIVAVIGLSVAVVALANRDTGAPSTSLAAPLTQSVGAGGTSAGGGPIDPGYGYGGHPERGYREALADPATGHNGGPEEGTRGLTEAPAGAKQRRLP